MKTGEFLRAVGVGLGWQYCPHCHSVDARQDCTRCGRQMCAGCIHDHPDAGPVCGICYDELQTARRKRARG